MAMVKDRIIEYLKARPGENAFLRSEFNDLAPSRAGVDKAVRTLVKQGRLVRGGYGILVRAKPGLLNGAPVPVVSPDVFAKDSLEKLGVPFGQTQVVKDYLAGKTTQIQANLVLSISGRTQRKIGWGKRMLRYERTNQKPVKKPVQDPHP